VRVRIGNLRLADLPREHWRMLTKHELQSLEGRAPARPFSVAGAPPSNVK
jgi:16S rRNA U516 pseudouridylate synthase RsuA-like enzyme